MKTFISTLLRSQFVTAGEHDPVRQYDGALRSQFVTAKRGGRRTLPYAFTEHGAIMAATVLNSHRAVSMSLYVVRTFIQMREQIAANADILKRLAEIDHTLLKQGLQFGPGEINSSLETVLSAEAR